MLGLCLKGLSTQHGSIPEGPCKRDAHIVRFKQHK